MINAGTSGGTPSSREESGIDPEAPGVLLSKKPPVGRATLVVELG